MVDLSSKERRLLFYGTGDDWIDVHPPEKKKGVRPLFRFQYKGLYPALAEAARLSPRLRGKLAHLVAEVECGSCGGSRLRDDAAAVRLRGDTIDHLCGLPLAKFAEVVDGWEFDEREKKIAGELVREIANRTRFLLDVGLDYLTVARGAATLSGGEAQRIRLASQVGSGLCGVLYVLDEPTIGLHPRDNKRLIGALEKLRDLGNTLLVVEHDREVVKSADKLLDFGPRDPATMAARLSRLARRRKYRRSGRPSQVPICRAKRTSTVPTRIGGCRPQPTNWPKEDSRQRHQEVRGTRRWLATR